jgi:hypothetical protein
MRHLFAINLRFSRSFCVLIAVSAIYLRCIHRFRDLFADYLLLLNNILILQGRIFLVHGITLGITKCAAVSDMGYEV